MSIMVGLAPSLDAVVGASSGIWGGEHGVRDSSRPDIGRFVSTSRRIAPTNISPGVRWNEPGPGYGVRSPVSGGAWARLPGVETDPAVTTGDLQARRQRLDEAGVGSPGVFDRGSEAGYRETDVDPPHCGLTRRWSRW